MSFLPPNQQRQSTEGKVLSIVDDNIVAANTKFLCVFYRMLGFFDIKQLPTYVGNVTLLTFAAECRSCGNRWISPAHWAHSSKPAALACAGWMMGWTDGWTEARQFRRLLYILREQCYGHDTIAILCWGEWRRFIVLNQLVHSISDKHFSELLPTRWRRKLAGCSQHEHEYKITSLSPYLCVGVRQTAPVEQAEPENWK